MSPQQSMCFKKKPYFASIDAKIMANLRMSSGAPPLRVYQCDHCKLWHLTKSPAK